MLYSLLGLSQLGGKIPRLVELGVSLSPASLREGTA